MPECGGRICGTFPVLTHTGARGNPLENPAALPTPVSGRDRICGTGSVLSPATWPRVLPICRSVWLKCYLGVQCLLCLSFSAFFLSVFVMPDSVRRCVCSLCTYVQIFCSHLLYDWNLTIHLGLKSLTVNTASLPSLQFTQKLRIFFLVNIFFFFFQKINT